MTINIDGFSVSSITIDGTEVKEITVDGDVVFKAIIEGFEGSQGVNEVYRDSSSGWTIASTTEASIEGSYSLEVTQDSTNYEDTAGVWRDASLPLGERYSLWVKFDVTDFENFSLQGLGFGNSTGGYGGLGKMYGIYFNKDNLYLGELQDSGGLSGGGTSWSPANNLWYNFQWDVQSNGTLANPSVEDENGNVIWDSTISWSGPSDFSTITGLFQVQSISRDEVHTVYYDELKTV